MVTRIGARRRERRPIYLAQWRAHRGLSAEQMAGRLGIERESYYRWEREPKRINLDKVSALADALDIEPGELWRLPERPSLDAIAADATPEQQAMVADVVRRVLGKAS